MCRLIRVFHVCARRAVQFHATLLGDLLKFWFSKIVVILMKTKTVFTPYYNRTKYWKSQVIK